MKKQLSPYQGGGIGTIPVVKIGASRQVAIPKRLYDKLGLKPGDYLEIEIEEDHLVLTPKALIDRGLAEGLQDLKEGRVYGPFGSAKEMVESLHGSRRTKKLKKV